MRILYDHQAFSLQDSGGISRYYFELLRQISRLDDCAAEAFLGCNNNLFHFSCLPKIKVHELRGSLVMGPGKFRYLLNEAISNSVLPFRGRFDVYHPTLYRCAPLVRSTKVVVTHHDCAYERYPALFKNAESIKEMRARQFARADAIICPSESTRRDLHEFYPVSEDKTFVVYHGIPRPVQPDCSEHARIGDRPFLLYVGSRATYKNFDGLLRAFAAAGLKREFDLLVLGGGLTTSSEMTAIRELSLEEAVRFTPQAPDDFLARAYVQARLLVYPSLYEGFGFPPLEAMSFGCPVLVAHTSSLPEICADAAFYFAAEDHASFVEELRESCFNDAKRRQKIERERILVSSYSWEECATKTLQIYSSLLRH
jgi:glycosyltransferase involved in cell wall biosynthesis